MKKKENRKNWSRFSKDFEKLNELAEIQDYFGWFDELRHQLSLTDKTSYI